MNFTFDGEEQEATLALGSPVWFLHPSRTPINLEELKIHVINLRRYVGARDVRLIDHLHICNWLCERAPSMTRFLQFWDKSHNLIHVDRVIQKGFVSVHDLPEAILGDVSTGLKKHLADYRGLETIWEPHVHTEIGLPLVFRSNHFCKAIDMTALVLEMQATNHPRASFYTTKYANILPSEDIDVLVEQTRKTLKTKNQNIKWNTLMKSLEEAKAALKIHLEAPNESRS